ncbi:MAG: hypothetical protein ABSA53_21475 [Streptosporangiaceae bacterium]|jgi:hypothetical protein
MASVIIIMTIALFLCGLVTGVLAMVAVAVRREDRGGTLGTEAPNRMSRSARRLNGVACRDLDTELVRPAREFVH